MIIDLTPVRDRTGPARLLDMVEGRSKAVFTAWLNAQSEAFRDGIDVVAMDGFTGFKTAAADVVPDAVAVMDPFHVGALAGDAMDRCRQRVQLQTCGHRGRSGDPLYGIRRVLRTGVELLTDKQQLRLEAVFNDEAHHAVEATWDVYQRIIAAYRDPDRTAGKKLLTNIIAATSSDVPAALPELRRLGRTLNRRARLLRPPRHKQRPHGSDQRPPRTPPRHRAGLPQPHPLHRTIATRVGRIPSPTTPSIRMSPQSVGRPEHDLDDDVGPSQCRSDRRPAERGARVGREQQPARDPGRHTVRSVLRSGAISTSAVAAVIALASCGSDGAEDTDQDQSGGNAASLTDAVCVADAKDVADQIPAKFPGDFPFPPGTVVTNVDDRGKDGIVVTGVTGSTFSVVLKSLQTDLPAKGFTPDEGEVEPHDAESNFSSADVDGRWAIREIPACNNDVLANVLARPQN